MSPIGDAPGGRRVMWSIDRMVEWAKTSAGGRTYALPHAIEDPYDGCARWGMCEPMVIDED